MDPAGIGTKIIDEDVSGFFSFIGSGALVPLYIDLMAAGQFGFSDVGNTAKFTLDPLPPRVSYASASGDFPTGNSAAVPEPSSLTLLASLIGLGFVGRGRRKTDQTRAAFGDNYP